MNETLVCERGKYSKKNSRNKHKRIPSENDFHCEGFGLHTGTTRLRNFACGEAKLKHLFGIGIITTAGNARWRCCSASALTVREKKAVTTAESYHIHIITLNMWTMMLLNHCRVVMASCRLLVLSNFHFQHGT